MVGPINLGNFNSLGTSTPFGILFRQTKVVIGQSGSLGGAAGILSQTIGGVTGIVLDASISEEHLAESEVTENPVEEGAKITDHVQSKPLMLTIEGIISDYPLGFPAIGNVLNASRTISNAFDQTSSRSIEAYAQLLKLRDDRQPFTVVTSLKKYDNMVIESLAVPRTAQSGRAIYFTIKMKQIRIVSSQSGAINKAAAPYKKIAQKVADHGQKITETTKNISSKLNDPGGSVLSKWFGAN